MNKINIGLFWGAFLTNVLAGIAITIALIILNEIRYYYFLRRRFHNRTFKIFYKNVDEPCREAVCKVFRNRIKYEGSQIVAGSTQGEFSG